MPLAIIIGPSAAGKSTLVERYLANHPEASLHKSATTRPKRDQHDNSHVFMTDSEFDQATQAGKFIYPIETYGHRYALPHLPQQSDQMLFVMIRQQFVAPLQKLYPKSTVIQIEASLDALIARLEQRGETNRIDKPALDYEISQGKLIAEHVVKTDQPFETSYQEFRDICNNL